MVQLQAGLHAVELLELDEREAPAFLRMLLLRRDPHGDGVDLAEVVRDGFFVGRIREVS